MMGQQSTVEVVIFAQPQPCTLALTLPAQCGIAALLAQLPDDLQALCRDLQPTRHGKRLSANAVIMPGDQVAWLTPVCFDPKLSRQARVEKQRKVKRRLRVQAFQAASLLAKTKKGTSDFPK
jgi:putative ubiquitin-RnfH superfamily antitoxin RatB of RatAB toxin-antitoxin module